MRPKRLRKKIRQLETRLEKDRRKLAKLEKKLKAVLAAEAKKRQKKASTRTIARLTVTPLSGPSETERAGEKPKKVRRRLNLSPERRAQLSAQMKARWEAKRAAAAAAATIKPAESTNSQDFLVEQTPQSAA